MDKQISQNVTLFSKMNEVNNNTYISIRHINTVLYHMYYIPFHLFTASLDILQYKSVKIKIEMNVPNYWSYQSVGQFEVKLSFPDAN